jgi:hypothetical protein
VVLYDALNLQIQTIKQAPLLAPSFSCSPFVGPLLLLLTLCGLPCQAHHAPLSSLQFNAEASN